MAMAPGANTERDLSWLDQSFPIALSPDGKTLAYAAVAQGTAPIGIRWDYLALGDRDRRRLRIASAHLLGCDSTEGK